MESRWGAWERGQKLGPRGHEPGTVVAQGEAADDCPPTPGSASRRRPA